MSAKKKTLPRRKPLSAPLVEIMAPAPVERFDVSPEACLQVLGAALHARQEDYYEWGSDRVPLRHRKTGEPILDDAGSVVMVDKPWRRVKNSRDLTRGQLTAVSSVDLSYSASGIATLKVSTGDSIRAASILLAYQKGDPVATNVNVTVNSVSVERPDFARMSPQEAMKEFERRRAERGLVWASKK